MPLPRQIRSASSGAPLLAPQLLGTFLTKAVWTDLESCLDPWSAGSGSFPGVPGSPLGAAKGYVYSEDLRTSPVARHIWNSLLQTESFT